MLRQNLRHEQPGDETSILKSFLHLIIATLCFKALYLKQHRSVSPYTVHVLSEDDMICY